MRISRIKSFPRLPAWLAILAASGAVLTAAEEVIRLPPLFVTESVSGVPWQYLAVPGYEVLSRSNGTLTREVVRGILEAEQLFKALVPEELQAGWSMPRLLVMTPGDQAVAASQEFLRGFAPSGARIELLDNIKFREPDVLATYAEIDPRRTDHNKFVLSEATAQDMLAARTPALPAWFATGLLELYRTALRDDTVLRLPALAWQSAAETSGLRNDPDYPRTLLPVEEVLRMSAPPPGHADARLWAAEAALFVRWSLDERIDMEKQLWKFVRLMAEGVPMEPALRDSLAMTPGDLRDRLSDYLPYAVRSGIVVRPAKWLRVTVPELRPATQVEVARIKGDLERMEISVVRQQHPEFADRYLLQARRTLTDESVAGWRDPNLDATVGLFLAEFGEAAAARERLQRAVDGQVQRPRVYLELARLLLAESLQSPAGSGGKLGLSQSTPIFNLLLAAGAMQPAMLDLYSLAAEVTQRSQLAPSDRVFALLDAGPRAFPFSLSLHYQTALADASFGRRAEALGLVEGALLQSEPGPVRSRFEALQRMIASGSR